MGRPQAATESPEEHLNPSSWCNWIMAILKYDPSFGGHDAIVAQKLDDGETVIAVTHGGYGNLGTMKPTDAKLYLTAARILIVPSASMRRPTTDPRFGTECITLPFYKLERVPKMKGLLSPKRLEFPEFQFELFGPKSFMAAATTAITAAR